MLQINNLEGKSDWINETQLIIPMVDNEVMSAKEMDGLSKHTITLNGLEDGDQTLLASASGQTFVIGLDQALFENYSSKSDLLLMSNSDLKLLPTSSDSKLTYTLPSVDHSKTEIVWENNTFEKPLSKDILNVIQDTSKSWQEMGKNGEMCLDDIHSVHDSKLNADFLIEPHMVQPKKLRTDTSDQYIVGYYPVVETCDTVLVSASLMTHQKKTGHHEQAEKSIVIDKDMVNNSKNVSQLFGNENAEGAQFGKWIKSGHAGIDENFVVNKMNNEGRASTMKIKNTQQNSLILTQENINNLSETVIPLINTNNHDCIDAKSKNDINVNGTVKNITKDNNCDGKVLENENSTLSEQSLPLKKKAKMKKSPVTGSFTFSTGESGGSGQSCSELCNAEAEEDEERNAATSPKNAKSTDTEDLKRKRKYDGTAGSNLKKKKKEEKELERGKCNYQNGEHGNRHEIRYDSITQLLEQLKNEKYINEPIFRILRKGLQEMDVDVLEEMYRKREAKCPDYSSHLKAFALMLHFKQPAAFNRLGELFQSGWPPLTVIKDWKRRLNNHRKPKKMK